MQNQSDRSILVVIGNFVIRARTIPALTYKSRILNVDALPDPSFTEAFTRSKRIRKRDTIVSRLPVHLSQIVTVGCGIGPHLPSHCLANGVFGL
jgi:hypothetical protein